MEISVSELAEYAEHVRKVERNGKVTVTNNYNEGKIAALEAALKSLEEGYQASERDIQTRDETIYDLRGELRSVTVERDALERRLATYEPAVQPVGQATPGPRLPANRVAVEIAITERLHKAHVNLAAPTMALIGDELVRQGLVK